MALPKKAVATLPFALGAATLGSSKIGRDAMGDLSTKLGLKAAEKPLRNLAGNMFERAANVGAKKIQKALSPLGELQLVLKNTIIEVLVLTLVNVSLEVTKV